jgi:hypothetical protein
MEIIVTNPTTPSAFFFKSNSSQFILIHAAKFAACIQPSKYAPRELAPFSPPPHPNTKTNQAKQRQSLASCLKSPVISLANYTKLLRSTLLKLIVRENL